MAERVEAEIAIVGGGIVGLACALRLAAYGSDVLLIDAGVPAVGASAGNAGTIAAYNNVPIGTPGVLRQLPHLLLARDSPFALRWAALPSLAPWLLRFLRAAMPSRAAASAAALAALLADALPAWRELAALAAAGDLIRRNGSLYLFRDDAALAGEDWNRGRRDVAGVRQTVVGPPEIAALEPALAGVRGPGLFFPDAAHLADPAAMLARLRAAFLGRGGRIEGGRIDTLRPGAGAVTLDGPGVAVRAGSVVIAAGAWSGALARQAGDRVPLETERGYHIEYRLEAPPLSRPVAPIRFGVYLTPMPGRLRAAGTVELGGFDRPAYPRLAALLDRAARSLLPGLPAPGAPWLGFRPSLPDSLPVIGPARGDPRIIHAFGHGHLGLTLAAVTARHVADMIAGRTPGEALAAFSARRFGC